MRFDDGVRERLKAGAYDVVICHTIRSLFWVWRYTKPRYVFCAHIPLWTHGFVPAARSLVKRLVLAAFRATHQLTFVPTSPLKKASWRAKEPALLTCAEPMPAATFAEKSRALVVCNDLESRDAELGGDLLRAVQERVPLAIVGKRNGARGSIEPADYQAFLDTAQRFGVYLYPIASPWGDGYNIALLEAMQMGMAIVTVAHPFSPIEDGVSGLVGDTPDELASAIRRLLADEPLARRLGAAAKRSYEARFGRARFAADWRALLGQTKPLVSVVVTTFNGEAFLNRTLGSVARQTYPHWECLVVDDGSTDDTKGIIQSWVAKDARFRLVERQHCGFPSRCRNAGTKEAQGELIAVLDHDDFWHPEKLALQVEARRRFPDAAIIHTPRLKWYGDGTPAFSCRRPLRLFRRDDSTHVLERGCLVTHSSVLIPRAALDAAGGYREDLLAVDDYFLFLRLARLGAVVRVAKPLTYVLVHDRNLSSSKRTMVEGLKRVVRALEEDGDAPEVIRSVRAQALKSEGVMLLRSEPLRAQHLFVQSLRTQPRTKTMALWILATLILSVWRQNASVRA